MKNIIRLSVSLLALLLSLSSCVHQWPESVPTSVTLKFMFDRSITPFDTLQFDTKADNVANLDTRYVVEAYRMKADGSYYRDAAARQVYTKDGISDLDHEVVFTVPDEGSYTIKAWVDYVNKGTTNHKYYNTDKFSEIILYRHEGNSDYREAFIGTVEVDVIRYGSQVPLVEGTLQMSRPVAKYEFISEDLDEFIEKETRLLNIGVDEADAKELDLNDYTVRIYYTGFMPSAFNMHSNRPNDSKTGVYYDSKIQPVDGKNAKLGFDFVLANPDEASVVAAVVIYDKEGTELAGTTDIHIPLRRGKLTTVKGSFLMKESSGGVSINPDFDGEFNIKL